MGEAVQPKLGSNTESQHGASLPQKSLPPTRDSSLRQAYRGERPEHNPVWFIGQSVREHPDGWSEWSVSRQVDWKLEPEQAVEVAVKPVEELGVDAAVCFPDALLPLQLAGINLRTGMGLDGRRLLPVRSGIAVQRLLDLPLPDWSRISKTVAQIRRQLPPETVLIGFGSSPFVMASVLVEGTDQLTQNLQTRSFLQSQPRNWELLMNWCSELIFKFMQAQVSGGAEAIQMVDPWARTLSDSEYKCMAEPYARSIFALLPGITKISCNLGVAHLMQTSEHYVDVLGVGSNISLSQAARVTPGKILQGNLDPRIFYSDLDEMKARARDILIEGQAAPAHVFNCAGALPPDTDRTKVRALVDYIHELSL